METCLDEGNEQGGEGDEEKEEKEIEASVVQC